MVLRKKLIYLSIALLIFFVSCAKTPPRVAKKELREKSPLAVSFESKLKSFEDATRTVKALAKVELTNGEEFRRTDAVVVIKRPTSIRVDAIDNLADVWAQACATNKKMWLYLPSKHKIYSGKSNRSNLHRLAKFDLEINELLSALAGSPLVEADGIFESKPGSKAQYESSDGNVKITVDKKILPVKVVRLSGSTSDPDYEIEFSDYKKVGDVFFPYSVIASFPKMDAQVMVNYTEVELGASVDDGVFSVPK